MVFGRRVLVGLLLVGGGLFGGSLRGAEGGGAAKIEFVQETLENGLRVIYAPLHQAPVVHVRVLYHVGSRDERPDRQGFAHMFEHMMFRGSAHVKPEEHMKLIGMVGGMSNAFTSFDQTVYVNTIPANHLEMALYLEADRMSSFKVSENIYKTERKVVGEEWGRMMNKPYGTMFEDFFATAFTTHSYRWTPIGNMQHLQAAHVEELQDFFNTYYVPNNAVLVIAGDIDVEQAKGWVHRFYGWIPKGGEVPRVAKAEPGQTQVRRLEEPRAVPLPAVVSGYHIPPYKSDDLYALQALSDILGSGSSSRLERLLVNGENPLCSNVSVMNEALEDGGLFGVIGIVMLGKDPAQVEAKISEALAEVAEKGVTEAELEKAKTGERISHVHNRLTATSIATQVGEEALLAGDPGRVNTEMQKIEALTVADIQAVAKKYLSPTSATVLRIKPDFVAAARAATSQPVTPFVAPSTRPVTAREVVFPAGYPEHAPINTTALRPNFEKGTEVVVEGAKVIVLPDKRLPLVNWTVTLRRGSHAETDEKAGLGGITAALVRHGAGELNYAQLNQDLDSRGISIDVTDSGDITRLAGACTVEQLEHAIEKSRDVLRAPLFSQEEFDKLKQKSLSDLQQYREDPDTVASYELSGALFAGTPMGRHATPETVKNLTLEDVKAFWKKIYVPTDAVICISGDVTVERGQELAKKLLEGWKGEGLVEVKYNLPAAPAKRRIILVDRPEGRQSMIRMEARGYGLHDPLKYAGTVGDRILSHGIDSRLGRYVRAEKGYVYSVWGMFMPTRQAGSFKAGSETSFKTTADTVEAMFKVFDDMRKANVTDQELAEAKLRVSGGLLMAMQTIQQQASYRVEAVLDDYPLDYFDKYPENINGVTAEQVRQVSDKYIRDDQMVVVVVAPAKEVKEQLDRLGEVEVVAMPSRRSGATTAPSGELVKPVK